MKRTRSEELSTQSDKRRKTSKRNFIALRRNQDTNVCARFTTALQLNDYWLRICATYLQELTKLFQDKANRLRSRRTVQGINTRINMVWDEVEWQMDLVKLCAERLHVQNPVEKTPLPFKRRTT